MNTPVESLSHAEATRETPAALAHRWNILVTVRPSQGAVHELLEGLHTFGEFRITPFHYVCTGWVRTPATFLDALLEAEQAGRRWTRHIGRVVPVDRTFEFVPESLKGKLESAIALFVDSIAGGTIAVRVERRGLAKEINAAELELALAEHVFAAAEARGKTLRAALDDPDYIVAVETLETECGVALIPRELRKRYPFVRMR